MKIRHGLYLLLTLVLVACYTVPETGRKAFNLAPQGLIRGQAASAFRALKKKDDLSTDEELNKRVKTIGTRIVNALGSRSSVPLSDWEFVVFEDDESINAFAMPGGKVAIYTGLFKAIESDEELAFVMGHEIGHVMARHGGERMTQALAVAAGGYGVDQLAKDQDKNTRRAIMMAYGAGTTFGFVLPYSRSHESEADQMGLLYMARAGYNPKAALQVWEKMARAGEGKKTPPEWMSTHPAHTTRTAKMKSYLPYAMAQYRSAIKRSENRN